MLPPARSSTSSFRRRSRTPRARRGAPALLAIGLSAVERRIDLGVVGSPGCFVHLDPIVLTLPTAFGAMLDDLVPSAGARATAIVPVPGDANVLGLRFAAQWFELGATLWSSNALECTIGAALPALDVATVVARAAAAPPPANGIVHAGLAHVVRFELAQ